MVDCFYPLEILIHANMHRLQHFSTVLYLEGNLETKVFCDPITGLVRRIREIAVRANGMLLTLLIYIDNLHTIYQVMSVLSTYLFPSIPLF